ncbi:MAG: HD domain-containing phosphohydrolase [Thermodesulfobacteriota bacterium]
MKFKHPETTVKTGVSTNGKLTLNPFTLNFIGDYADYENSFYNYYLSRSLKQLRYAILLGIISWSLFAVLDLFLDPDNVRKLWAIRFGIIVPVMLGGMVVSFSRMFRRMMQLMIALSIFAIGCAVIAMIPVASNPLRHTYYAGLIIVFLFAYTLLRFRFIWATICCWSLVLIYEVVAIIIDTPPPVLFSNNFFFITANITGMFACYIIELSARKDFFYVKMIEAEQEKVKAANRELEENVQERTRQLIKINEDLNLTISEHKRSQENLKKSEEKYRTIIDNIEEGFYEIDLAGNFTFVNSSTLDIYNCESEDQLLGKNFRDYITKEKAEETLWILNEVYQTRYPAHDMNWEIKRADGSFSFLEVSASRIDNSAGAPVGFRGIIRDITTRKTMEQKLLDSYENIKQTQTMTILGLAKLAEYRDQNTGEHLERIMAYTKTLTEQLQHSPRYAEYVTPEYIEDIYISSMLHDIGKVGIPDDILLKPGPLTSDEYEIVKEHSKLGGDALRAVELQVKGKSFLTIGKQICYFHHERWDGKGYPVGLTREEIPLAARIVAVADVYDALTSDRVYKKAISHEDAMDIIIKEKGRQFDPEIVDALLIAESRFKEILGSNLLKFQAPSTLQ